MIPLLLDMGLPRRTAHALVAAGWDVVHIAMLGRPTAPDEEIVELARGEGRAIVTLDRDFARLLAATDSRRPSVIHIRVQPLDHASATQLLQRLVPAIAADLASGCVVSVSAGGIRIRPLPFAAR